MENDTAPLDIPGEDPPPTFSGEQVAFLLRHLAVPGQPVGTTQPAPTVPSTPTTRARGGYNSSFGWMHLTTPDVAINAVLGIGLLVLGSIYAVQGVASATPGNLNGLATAQPVLLILVGGLFLLRTVVKWRRSRLYTTDTQVVYAVKAFWPLLILGFEQRAKLPKIDASTYSQNVLESVLHMNSGTLTLDTAAQGDEKLHHLKGVKNVEQLQKDIE